MGGPEFSQQYLEKLSTELEAQYENFVKHNESKNIFAAARTPAVLFTVMVAAYILSGIFGVIGLESFANLLNLIMGVALFLFAGWAYVRYSGDYRDLGIKIDQLADFIWENVSILYFIIWFFKLNFCDIEVGKLSNMFINTDVFYVWITI